MLSDILTLRTIPAIVFSCVAYFMIGAGPAAARFAPRLLNLVFLTAALALAGLKPTADAFFLFMFTVILSAYTATAMALAISADQTVVAIANIFMTIACVFMMVMHTNATQSRSSVCGLWSATVVVLLHVTCARVCVCADLCRAAGEPPLHRELAGLVKVPEYTTLRPHCGYRNPSSVSYRLLFLHPVEIVVVSPQALEINEFRGLNFCEGLNSINSTGIM